MASDPTTMSRPASPDAPRREIPAQAHESIWHAADGIAIRRIDWAVGKPGETRPRGSILFVPGRADFYEKYLETLHFWHDQGWRVTALDWRWQAGSGRFHADQRVGGVDDFSTWINDLAFFWHAWAEALPGPHVLIGHSMGGHLALRGVAEHAVRPDALVLSAPMLGFNTPIPRALQGAFGRLMCRVGSPARMAWKGGERPGDSAATRGPTLTHDDTRYADELWWREARPDLNLGPASWQWVQKASDSVGVLESQGVLESVDVPVLMLGTRVDKLVAWAAIERAAKRIPGCELVEFGPEAAHEILREADPVRDRVLDAIAAFLDRKAPAIETPAIP